MNQGENHMHHRLPKAITVVATAAISLLAAGRAIAQDDSAIKGPVKHVIVIFQENISFDHYFGTYPNALNPTGEPAFHAKGGTPTVNGYGPALLNSNPNLNPANGTGATNPFRLDRSQAVTADQDHDYLPEQQAFDMGAMDLFPKFVGTPGPPPS